ncbi:hypothetical protein ABK040_011983 [Willaertia magna]
MNSKRFGAGFLQFSFSDGNNEDKQQEQLKKKEEGNNNVLLRKKRVENKSQMSSSQNNNIPPTNISLISKELINKSENKRILIKNLKDFNIGSRLHFKDEITERQFAIFRTDKNEVYALDCFCYHMGGPLHQGDIEELTCYYGDSNTTQQVNPYNMKKTLMTAASSSVNDKNLTAKKHVCVICPWHHYYISLISGESFYLDLDMKYKSKGTKQRVYPLIYDEELNLYLEIDWRLLLDNKEEIHQSIPKLDSDYYVKIHQKKNKQTDAKPHSVVNKRRQPKPQENNINDSNNTTISQTTVEQEKKE